jgi:hypothetical protein
MRAKHLLFALALVVGAAFLVDAQTSQFIGGAVGRGLFADGSASAPSVSFASDTNTGRFRNGDGDQIDVASGASIWRVYSSGVIVAQNKYLGFGSSGSGVEDTILQRGGAGLLNLSDADGTPDLNLNVGGSPALSTCGDGALATGSSNTSGRVTGTTQTACTLTFSASFGGNSADCVMANLIANRGFVSAASATAFTVSSLTAGDDFMYWCAGR